MAVTAYYRHTPRSLLMASKPQTLTVISPDGDTSTHDPVGKSWTLAEVRALIGGGYLESIPSGRTAGVTILVDEDGRMKNLPHNPMGSAHAGRPGLLGTVVLVPKGVRI